MIFDVRATIKNIYYLLYAMESINEEALLSWLAIVSARMQGGKVSCLESAFLFIFFCSAIVLFFVSLL